MIKYVFVFHYCPYIYFLPINFDAWLFHLRRTWILYVMHLLVNLTRNERHHLSKYDVLNKAMIITGKYSSLWNQPLIATCSSRVPIVIYLAPQPRNTIQDLALRACIVWGKVCTIRFLLTFHLNHLTSSLPLPRHLLRWKTLLPREDSPNDRDEAREKRLGWEEHMRDDPAEVIFSDSSSNICSATLHIIMTQLYHRQRMPVGVRSMEVWGGYSNNRWYIMMIHNYISTKIMLEPRR